MTDPLPAWRSAQRRWTADEHASKMAQFGLRPVEAPAPAQYAPFIDPLIDLNVWAWQPVSPSVVAEAADQPPLLRIGFAGQRLHLGHLSLAKDVAHLQRCGLPTVMFARTSDRSDATATMRRSIKVFGGEEVELIDADGPMVRAFEDEVLTRTSWRRISQVYGWAEDADLGRVRDTAMMMAFLLHGVEERPSLALVDVGQAAHSALARTVAARLRRTAPVLAYRRLLRPLGGRAGRASIRDRRSTIFLEDGPAEIRHKLESAVTGGRPTAQEQRAVGGDPTRCAVFETIELLCGEDRATRALHRCVTGETLCGSCKREHVEEVVESVQRHRQPPPSTPQQLVAGTSPTAMAALRRTATTLRRPPPRSADELERLIAAYAGVDLEQVVVASGATEAMSWVVDEQAGPGAAVVGSSSFELYEQLAGRAGLPYRVLDWDESTGRHDLDQFRSALARSAVCFLDSPHTVSGVSTRLSDVLDLLPAGQSSSSKLVVDNVYNEFMETPLALSSALVEHYAALVVCRSLSKAHCLLGARLGYAVTNAALADRLRRRRLPFAISTATLAAAEAAVLDTTAIRRNVTASRAARDALTQVLDRRGVRYLPTDANFMLIDLAERRDSIVSTLRARGVRFRGGRRWHLPTMVQVHLIDEPTIAPFIHALTTA